MMSRGFFDQINMLSRTNTQALKGFAAISIFVFHILLGYNITPLFNMWGGLFVAVFLILSGYGIEESYQQNGLDGFWRRRLDRVVLPFVFFVCAYNYVFSSLFPKEPMHKCLDELLYQNSAFWFVFFILKCYVVYWIGTRFMGQRLRLIFFVTCAFVCLNMQAPCGHLEAEQSFSFFAGVLLSMYKHRVEALSDKEVKRWMFLLFFVGAVFLCLKSIPCLHELKGSIAYNYMLCPFRLTTGLAAIPLLTMLRVERSSLLRIAGKYSMDIYIAHIPFLRFVVDAQSTAVFLAYFALSFGILMIYRCFVERKLTLAATIYIAINALFVAKYSARLFAERAIYATLAAVVGYYVLIRLIIPYFKDGSKGHEGWTGKAAWGFCLLAFLGMVAVQYAIDPYTLQVDRWSALHFPIQNLLSGIYPYTASTHLGGNASPFPVWQVLHIPFYLVGNVGLSFFVASCLFIWSCWRVQGKDKALIISLLMCSSAAVWYEVAVRSDLIANFLLLAAIINIVLPHINQQWVEKERVWIACAVGLIASTRVLVLIPVALLLLPYFIKMNWRKQLVSVFLTVAVFGLTFAPFALWDWHEFYYFHNNPWALQTSQGNLSDFILFVPIAIFLSMNHKGNANRYFRNSAAMLVVFIAITFVHNMYGEENWDLFSSTYDITYFSTALPFCLLALLKKDRA